MENTFVKIMLIDDEPIVREGLRHIVDWKILGYCICAESEDGEEALKMLKQYQPDLVLLDIKMPNMSGIEFMQEARAYGYKGDFIILSGYSDFHYAQTALRCGASFYLSKPVDEDELSDALLTLKTKIINQRNEKKSMTQYLKKAKSTVLFDLFTKNGYDPSINYVELNLYAPIYQVVIYEAYTPFFTPYSFTELLKDNNHVANFFEHIVIENMNVILLKGNSALKRFANCLHHYEDGPEKGSPLDSIFLTCSQTVPHLSEVTDAYHNCKILMERRFFCSENQHVLSCEDLPPKLPCHGQLPSSLSQDYGQKLTNYIQAYNRRMISQILTDLKDYLYNCGCNIISIKHFLADIFLQIKQNIMHNYSNYNIPFAHNAAIIELIENKYYLYEILLYFTEQFDIIIRAIGNHSSESVIDDILYYMNHNYSSSLKLESIAPLFGYSSSYLGKLIQQKTGENFNTLLDNIRIKNAIRLLSDTDMKVYEIASRVGYKKVDSFHQKFKKLTGSSPAEYRKLNIPN